VSVGSLFFIGSALIAFLSAAGIVAIPNAVLWSIFCLALGLLLSGVPMAWPARQA
jgi:uncharacterized membrane protein